MNKYRPNLPRRQFLRLAAAGALASVFPAARAQAPITVVASFSILGDVVRQIGGERVAVTTLVGADEDAHAYQGKPSDAQAVARAQLLVANGLGFDDWFGRLARASGSEAPLIVASDGISPRSAPAHEEENEHEYAHNHDHDPEHQHSAHEHEHAHHGHDHGGLDPHAWQNPLNVKRYAANIAAALSELDPQGRATYEANLAQYQQALDALDRDYHAFFDALPADARTLITAHDAFSYLADAYGLKLLAPAGVAGESQPSAAAVAAIIAQIRQQNVRAVFLESGIDPRLMQQIAKESGARVGEALFSDALSSETGAAPTYLHMMRHNLDAFRAALAPAKP